MKQESPVFPRIEQLVPHRGAMLWLDRLTGGDVNAVEAEARVPSAGWYLDERGCMPAWMGIEMMAQAVAAHAGLRGWLAGKPPKPGVLLGCRVYRVGASRVAAGTLLRITARVSYADENGFGAYDCAIRDASIELATATLKVYEPDDAEAFFRTMAEQR